MFRKGEKEIKHATGVVYFNQGMGALHTVCWWNSYFSAFFFSNFWKKVEKWEKVGKRSKYTTDGAQLYSSKNLLTP